MIRMKIDIIQELKKAGYNTGDIRRKKLLSENTLQQIREGKTPGIKSLNVICELLKRQPGQILEWIPDKSQEKTGD